MAVEMFDFLRFRQAFARRPLRSRKINIRIVSDNGTPATQTPKVLTQVGISQRRTDLDLPNDFTTASTDPKNFKIDVFDDKAVGGTITAKLKMLKPDGAAFASSREYDIKCKL
jgi:hypothetical protein